MPTALTRLAVPALLAALALPAAAQAKTKAHHATRAAKATTQRSASGPAPTDTHVTVDAVVAGTFHMKFTATHLAGEGPTNYDNPFGAFTADVNPLGAQLMHLEGPLTCMETDQNKVGFFYPVTKSDPSIFAGATGIFIYVEDGGPGGANDKAGFVPTPLSGGISSCQPVDNALFPVTSGDITVTHGG